MSAKDDSALERAILKIKPNKKIVALAVGGLILVGTAALREARHRELISRMDDLMSCAAAAIEERSLDSTSPKVGIAMSTSGRKLAGHVAAYECLENRFDLYSNGNRIEFIGMSGGAEIGAIIKLSHQMYLENPDAFGGRTPAERTKKLLLESQNVLRLNNPAAALTNGMIDRRSIEEFLKRIFDERNFNDIPDLYIVAKTSSTGRYIVFGDHVKNFPVWRAIMGAFGHRGIINREPFGGDLLEDAGGERKIPLEEIYSHKYLTHRILIYLGMHTDAELYQVEGNPFCELGPHTDGFKGRASNYAKSRILNRDATSSRERMLRTKEEFIRSLKQNNCRELDDILECLQDDVIVVAPRHEFVPYLGNGFPINGLYELNYAAADATLDSYFGRRPGQSTFGNISLRPPVKIH